MIRRLFFILTTVPLMVSCGGTYDSNVTGTVTLDGTLLQRGTVSFKPKQSGPTSYGLIAEDGSYELKTGLEIGLPAGEYVAVVVANEPSISKEEGMLPTPGKPITPPWYRSANTSGLDCSVEPGNNEINLELSTEPSPGYEPPKRRRRR